MRCDKCSLFHLGIAVTRYRVECIKRRGAHYSAHERIEGLGGMTPWKWYDVEDNIILFIEKGLDTYYVMVSTVAVDVIVSSHNGRKYLKTRSDGYAPDNLLALRECS